MSGMSQMPLNANPLMDFLSSICKKVDLEELQTSYIEQITSLISVDACGFYYLKPEDETPINIVAHGVDEAFLNLYERKGRCSDPLHARVRTTFAPFQSNLMYSLTDWQKHPVYGVFSLAKMDYVMEAPLVVAEEIVGTINFARSFSHNPFTDQELQIVSMLKKFLEIPIANLMYINKINQQKELFCQALNLTSQAIVLSDQQGNIQYANPSARVLSFNAYGVDREANVLGGLIRESIEKTGALKQDSTQISAQVCRIPGSSNMVVAFLDKKAFLQDFSGIEGVLTKREIDVLSLVAQGMHNKEIADTLVISVNTVKRHLDNMYGKLNAFTRTELVAKAYCYLKEKKKNAIQTKDC